MRDTEPVSKPRSEPLHQTGTLLTILLGTTARKQISTSPQHLPPLGMSEEREVRTFIIDGFCTDP